MSYLNKRSQKSRLEISKTGLEDKGDFSGWERNEFTDKCKQLWSNFDKPTKPLLSKLPIVPGRFNIIKAKCRLQVRKKIMHKGRGINKSEIIKSSLPSITKIYSKRAYIDIYKTWDVDSDDDNTGIHLNKY